MPVIEDIDFSNLLVKKMYKKDLNQIISLNDLNYDASFRDNLIVFDETSNFSPNNSLVVGGLVLIAVMQKLIIWLSIFTLIY
ncbi:Uncharacterised protein [Streptococcus pseudopneumoniae]|uniref:hypothetical protein n=1 Tax=Streptococcus pseudopneumoniae TaxID=257758 RepID=UPI0005E2DA62|nr:hypothetical protein [Streptococcus pseudopneumoniae]COC85770.1 Uncharacterised protein [Streptococcus pseudopneumoniae]